METPKSSDSTGQPPQISPEIYALKHLIINHILTTPIAPSDIPSVSHAALIQLMSDWIANENDSSFTTIYSIFTFLQFSSFCFQLPSENSSIIESFPSLFMKFMANPFISSDSALLNQVVRKILLQISIPYDFPIFPPSESFENRLQILKISRKIFSQTLYSSYSSLFDELTYQTAFEIAFGICDWILSSPKSAIEMMDSADFFFQTALHLTKSRQSEWQKHSSSWSQWASYSMFIPIWSNIVTDHCCEYVDAVLSKNADSTEMRSAISQCFLIIGHKTPPLRILLDKMREILCNVGDFIQAKINTMGKLYVCKFPVQIVADLLIDRALTMLESHNEWRLLLETLRLISLCGFDSKRKPFQLQIYIRLLPLLKGIIPSFTDTTDKITFLTADSLKFFVSSSKFAFSLIPIIADAFSTLGDLSNKSSRVFSTYMYYSAIPNFMLKEGLKYTSEAKENLQCHLSLVWSDFVNQRNYDTFWRKSSEFTSISLPLFILLSAISAYVSKISTFLSSSDLLGLASRAKTLPPDSLRAYLIAMIEISSVSGVAVPIDLPDEFKSIGDIPELLAILSQSRTGHPRNSPPKQSVDRLDGHFQWKDKLFSVYRDGPLTSTVLVRDSIGSSVLNLKQVLIDGEKLPYEAKIFAGKPVSKNTEILNLQGLVESEIEVKTLPDAMAYSPENDLRDYSSKGIEDIKDRRPATLEVMRSFDLFSVNDYLSVIRPSESVDTCISAIDRVSVLPKAKVPVFYVSQKSQGLTDSWDTDFVDSFFGSFAEKLKGNKWLCQTGSHRILFKKSKGEGKMAVVLSSSEVPVNQNAIQSLQFNLIIVIYPIGGGVFKMSIGKNTFKVPLAFGPQLIVPMSKMKVHLVYLSFYSFILGSQGEFSKQAKRRRNAFNKLMGCDHITPLNFLVDSSAKK